MSASSEKSNSPIYFPLDQGERAAHLNVNQLLARDVYERLAEMLKESVPESADPSDEKGEEERFNRGRGHSTIFLDGDRGTGKTTVVVNLRQYLESDGGQDRFRDLAKQVHIFKPIDPSQLEDGDDLFLDVVVAAVLGDRDVNAQHEKEREKWEILNQSLQDLGVALQGRETQSKGEGLDRLRSFMGSQDLAGAVHRFFSATASLLGKRLLVMPIDDVDTTLHRAFENLEVVRRYLASPVLLPIVCGDLALYREVVWRDTYGRLTMDTEQEPARAKVVAQDLAREYLRKILPLHRRMRMPEVGVHQQNENVLIGSESHREGRPRLALPELDAWLTALLAGPVNGNENSRFQVPIPTVRALSQLIFRVRTGVPALQESYFNESAPLPETDLMRRISYRRKGRAAARRHSDAPELSAPSNAASQVVLRQWHTALLDHFMFEPSAGAACLVLLAHRHWRDPAALSVLDTPIFQPLRQVAHPELSYVEASVKLNWSNALSGRLPDSWVGTLKDRDMSILPFSTPDIGRAIRLPTILSSDVPPEDDVLFNGRLRLLVDLITHRNFYSPSKRATLICSGRVIEIMVTSLVRDVSIDDIHRILRTAPFHSAVAVATTKAFSISIDELELEIDGDESADVEEDDEESAGTSDSSEEQRIREHAWDLEVDRDLAAEELAADINAWRRQAHVGELILSPWLIYCTLNKTFNQVPFFNRPLAVGQQPVREQVLDVLASGLSTFHAFWAALGSFEKGPLFDLPLETSNVNLLNRHGDFTRTDLFTQNVQPLIERQIDHATIQGEQVVSATWALQGHPLFVRLKAYVEREKERGIQKSIEAPLDGRGLLLRALGLRADMERLTVASIRKALKSIAPKGVRPDRHGERILDRISRRHRGLRELNLLRRAIVELGLELDAGAS